MRLPLSRIASVISATGNFPGRTEVRGYSIDSRTISAGELFFAVRGERLDGHDFVGSALQRGAAGAVVARSRLAGFNSTEGLLAVQDPLRALQALAAEVRRAWGKALVGVTGSAGKTTTKEAIAHLLAAKFRVLKSAGNLNNHFGLPLQLLKLEQQHDLAVVEMGMSHAGEIAALAKIACPNIGVVTNVAPVHLGFFKSVAEIALAKYELIESLPANGVAVLNADDPYVAKFARDFRGHALTYGIHKPASLRAGNIRSRGAEGSEFEVVAQGVRHPAKIRLLGEHNIYNALAAVAVSLQCGLSLSQSVEALATLAPPEKRGEVAQIAGASVINDCYNSNPKALDAMAAALAQLPAKRHIVVAGEMLELGKTSASLHTECGKRMAEWKIDVLIGVRGDARHLVEGARQAGVAAEFLETPEQAGEWLVENARAQDAILLKASRGVRLERALEVWNSKLEQGKTGVGRA